MVVMASDGPSPHSPSLRLGLPIPQPSRHHHAQSLLGPSFHDPRTHHVLESHLEQAAPLSHRDDERCHAIGSHSVLPLRLHLAACSPSSSCRSWVLDHLCSNLSQSFHLCWITEIRSLNLCVCFTFSSSAFTFQKYSTILILVLCLLGITPLVCSSYSSFAPSSPFFSSWWQKIVSYLHIHLFSNVLNPRRRVSPKRPKCWAAVTVVAIPS